MTKINIYLCCNQLKTYNDIAMIIIRADQEKKKERTKTSLLSLSIVNRLKDLNIGYHLPRRHRSSRGVKRKKQNLHSFIVASFNAQSVKGSDMASRRCGISTFIKNNGVDVFL